MPRFNGAHSTQCCGAHSFSGFDATCDTDPNLINAAMVGAPVGRLGDITLNGDQVRRPRMMQRLADLGFVLDAHWINSVHGSHVYRFTRCDSRRALLDGPIAGHWNGMVMEPNLTGNLPRIVQQQPAGNRANGLVVGARVRRIGGEPLNGMLVGDTGVVRDAPRNGAVNVYWERIDRAITVYTRNVEVIANLGNRIGINRFHVGDRVEVTAGMRAGRQFDVEGVVDDNRGYKVRMRDDLAGNAMFRISFDNVHLVQAVQDRNVAPAAAPAPHRHENARMPVLQDAAQAPARPANPQVVGRYWHCVFRDGRRGAGYQTYAEAHRNLGRRTRIDRFEILSDGNTRWVERVNN